GAAQHAAQAWRRRERGRAPRRRLRNRDARAAEDSPAPLPLGDRLLGARDQLDRRVVGVPNRRAPGDRAMTLEHERRRVGVEAERIRDVTPTVVALDGLDRRVAAPPDDERGLGADQTGGVDEEIEALEPAGLGVVPA